MKKIYFLASMLLLSGVASAQYQPAQIMRADVANMTEQVRPSTASHDRAPGDVISTYESTFDTPAEWTLASTSVPAIDWVMSSAGPTTGDPFASTTAADGFVWYDADPAGTGATSDATVTYNTVMDLSANADVAVEFESFYQEYQTQAFVEVSTNGLAGPWTQYELHTGITDNGATANPEITTVNISAQAGNQATVAVRFHYTGGWGWFWQIDDFKIVEAYQNELENTWSHFSSGSERIEYYSVPTSQITEITFGSILQSNGVTTQTNTYMDVQVDAGVEYAATSSQIVDLAEAVSDTFSVESPNGWTPSGAGTYDLVITGQTDDFTEELPGNDAEVYEPITVGGTTYARDNGVSTGGFSGFVSTVGEPLQPGNIFEFFTAESVGQVEIQLTNSTDSDGQLMFASVFKYDGVSDFTFEAQSADYQIQTGDLGTSLVMHLSNDVAVVPGDILLICAGHYGGGTPVSFAIAQPTVDGSVLAQSQGGLIQGSDPSAMMIRAILEPTQVGVEEQAVAVTGMSVYPSPANNNATLVYNLTQESNVAITVTDLAGRVILNENYGSQVNGAYQVELNTTDFSNGVYFYTLNVNGEKATKKFTVSH